MEHKINLIDEKVHNVPAELLRLHGINPRSYFRIEDLTGLMLSILKQRGFRQDMIPVVLQKDDNFSILTGHRRSIAYILVELMGEHLADAETREDVTDALMKLYLERVGFADFYTVDEGQHIITNTVDDTEFFYAVIAEGMDKGVLVPTRRTC